MGQRRITVSEVTKVQGEIFFNVSVNTACKQIYFSLRKQNNVVYLLPYGLVSLHRGADAHVLIVHMSRGSAVSSEVVATLMNSPLAA